MAFATISIDVIIADLRDPPPDTSENICDEEIVY
jgi:hypothetical protein